VVVPNPQSHVCEMRESGNSSTPCGITVVRRNFLYLAALVTIVLALARLVVEVFQLVHWTQSSSPNCCGKMYKLYINWGYWLEWTNYLEIILYAFSVGFVVAVFDDCFCPTDNQWQIGTVAIFFAWINLLLFLYKLPKIGIYVGMMLKITRRFLDVVVIAGLLLLAFGFAFYMAFYEPSIPASPFIHPALTFVKLMVMTSGGPDDSIFRYENEGSGERSDLPFPAVAFFIWVVFIIIMAILFVNFLVGLAVDDVKEIQQSATLRRLSLKVDLVLSMEQAFPILRHHKKIAVERHTVHPNKHLPWHKRLWEKVYSLVWDDDLTNSIKSSLNPEEDTDFKVDSLQGVVELLASRSRSQGKMLTDIHEKMLTLTETSRASEEMDSKMDSLQGAVEQLETTLTNVVQAQETKFSEILRELQGLRNQT
jgi:transient receptor potential cation channel subfamily A protein 1